MRKGKTKKHVTIYGGHTVTHKFRLYEEDVRRLLGVPIRKGRIKDVRLVEGTRIEIDFEQVFHKCTQRKFI